MGTPNAAPDKTKTIHGALLKLQGKVMDAKKSGDNPHFGSSYATLKDMWDACRKHLNDLGLVVTQYPAIENGEYVLMTELSHVPSGESVTGKLPIVGADNMQKLGSAITYARRYALATMVGIIPEDDDGTAAVGSTSQPAAKSNGSAPATTSTAPASKAQIGYLKGLLNSKDLETFSGDAADIGERMSNDSLTKADANKYITELKSLPDVTADAPEGY